MPDQMTAARLAEIVEPVWAKHPGTRPRTLNYVDDKYGKCWTRSGATFATDGAEMLCEAQMVRWLVLGDYSGATVIMEGGQSVHHNGHIYEADTLIEALAAACLAVAQPGAEAKRPKEQEDA